MDLLPLAALTLAAWGLAGSLFVLGNRDRPAGAGAALFLLFSTAGALAVVPSMAVGRYLPPGTDFSDLVVFTWTLGAPVEELSKYLFFAAAAGVFRTLRRPQDGVFQGAATGLGFALAEDWLYALHGGWPLALLRTFVSLPGHLVYGAVWGGYHSHEFYRGRPEKGRLWVPMAALVPAIFAHALSNTLSLAGASWFFSAFVDLLIFGFGVFLFFQLRRASRQLG